MIEKDINIYSLKNISLLSKITCDNFSECAAVCLDDQNHKQGVSFSINGALKGNFRLYWYKVTKQMKNSRNDFIYTTENGAYCLAMLIIQHLTKYKVIKQAKRKTGFDYYLAQKSTLFSNTNIVFNNEVARLEVSGILKAKNNSVINIRLKTKIEQTRQSDHMNIPAYAIVIEFSSPLAKIAKK